jgi:hypothetical protein
MTPAEREAFRAEVHVAVVTVADDDGRGPLAIPLWYDYRPGGEINPQRSAAIRPCRAGGRPESVPARCLSVQMGH